MDAIKSLFLGLIQGLTEFFPVSSSGHLFLFEKILDIHHNSLSFVVILHGASLLSIATVFFKELKSFAFDLNQPASRLLLLKVVVSSIPIAFVGLFLKSLVEQSFHETIVISGFLGTGLLLLSLPIKDSIFRLARFGPHSSSYKPAHIHLNDLSFTKAFVIGIFQALAVLPGFSRSGWTVSISLFLGLSANQAVYYSFLIALPAIGGSLIVEVIQNFHNIHFSFNLLLAFVTAYASGTLALFLILKLVQKQKFFMFAFYLLPLSFYLLLF